MATAAPGSTGPLRVLIAHPGAELFGSDRMVLETAAGLVAAGHRVLVTVPGDGPLLPLLRAAGAAVVVRPTPVLRKSFLTPTGLVRLAAQAIRGLASGLRLALRARPDVLYVSTLTIPLWIAVGRLCGIPVVTHVHEAERSAGPLLRRALAAPVLMSDRVLSNSAFSTAALADAFPALAARTTIVHNGVAGPATVRPARAQLDGGLRVLYVGRLSERKGVDVVVDAVAALRDRGVAVELDVVGAVFAGNEAYEELLRERIAAAGLAGAVRLHGFKASVWDDYARCDVAVVPSRVDEPFGNTAVEAILAGRPVVVSDTSGLREASDGMATAVRAIPGDSASLADALDRIGSDWTGFRDAVAADRVLAGSRHDPAAYRRRVVGAVVAASRSTPGRQQRTRHDDRSN